MVIKSIIGAACACLEERLMRKFVLGAEFILLSTSTHAVTLNPGETVSLSGTTAILSPETAGPILEEQISNFAVEIEGKMVTGAVSQRLRDFGG